MRGYKKKNKKNEEKVLTLFQISSIIVNVLGGTTLKDRDEKPRPLGQAVKTPPFHGGNRGSIPLGVTILNLEA